MKTIEERAQETYPKGAGVFTPEGAELLQKAYVRGATEQKDIDDAERDTAVYNLLMLKLDDENKLWLEKACEWFSEHIIEYVCYTEMDGWDIRHKEMHEDFRKAMEE